MRLGLGALVLAVLLAALPAHPQQEEVQNDGFQSGGTVNLQLGFVEQEIAAARLVPQGPCPCQVLAIKFILGDTQPGRQGNFTLWIWEDDLDESFPFDPIEPELLLAGIQPTSANDSFQLIEIDEENVFVDGPFRVGFEFLEPAPPSVVTDADGNIQAYRNFIRADSGFWLPAESFGVSGDFVIRAILPEPSGSVGLGVSVALLAWLTRRRAG